MDIINEANEQMLYEAMRDADENDPDNDNDNDNHHDSGTKGDLSSSEEEENPTNQGTLIIDSTCAPVEIRYPQDCSLLNEAREILEE